MKYLYLIISILFISCDNELVYDYVVQNDSPHLVFLSIEGYNNSLSVDTILIGQRKQFNKSIGYGRSVYEFELKALYKNLTLRTDSLSSDYDYSDNRYWSYVELSKTHAVYRLIVDSTHFK